MPNHLELFNNKLLEWMKEYEESDPEPIMILSVPNKHDHRKTDGTYLAYEGNLGYPTAATVAHIAWHRRMTEAYKNR